jgi:hypothetical protein
MSVAHFGAAELAKVVVALGLRGGHLRTLIDDVVTYSSANIWTFNRRYRHCGEKREPVSRVALMEAIAAMPTPMATEGFQALFPSP